MSLSETERDQLCARARAAWPELSIDSDQLAEFLERSGIEAASDDQLAELALAFAVSKGDDAAVAAFEDSYLSVIPAALAHMKLDAAAVDDVRQSVREKLVIPSDGACKLERYAGKGTLRGLVRVVAVRTALHWIKKHRRELAAETDELRELPAAAADPELAFIKERYRREFKSAFGAAIDGLADRERNLLRLHVVGGVTLETLAQMYGVHRATVTRWLAKARRRVLESTRKGVERSLQLEPAQFDEMMELIRSRLDLSVSRVLRARDGAVESES